jgi:CspA family cold shock protein
MAVRGVVREWHDDEGWGVVDAAEVGGGCWVSFAHVAVDGYRRLRAGQEVALEWEAARQDGFDCRATRVWPWPGGPAPEGTAGADGTGYFSSLRLDFEG